MTPGSFGDITEGVVVSGLVATLIEKRASVEVTMAAAYVGIHYNWRLKNKRNINAERARNKASKQARAEWSRACQNGFGRTELPFPVPVGMQQK